MYENRNITDQSKRSNPNLFFIKTVTMVLLKPNTSEPRAGATDVPSASVGCGFHSGPALGHIDHFDLGHSVPSVKMVDVTSGRSE